MLCKKKVNKPELSLRGMKNGQDQEKFRIFLKKRVISEYAYKISRMSWRRINNKIIHKKTQKDCLETQIQEQMHPNLLSFIKGDKDSNYDWQAKSKN